MKALFLAATLAPALPADEASAAACRGVEFPDTVDIDGQVLALNGLGLRLATVLNVKVYVAALYVTDPSSDAAQVLAAGAPKRLELHFLRDVDVEDLNASWDTGFARNASAQLPALSAQVAQLKGWMRDMRAGQRLVFVQTSGGIVVDVAGTSRGSIEGGEFAAALFSIWLGQRPPNPELKAGLLGGGCE